MHGTYFFQNEVFEDESAGEVHVPLASLGTSHPVYLGKSIEGVLRGRVHPHECSFEVVTADGGETFVEVSLAKAEPVTWGELLLDGLGASFARFRLSSLEAAVAVVAFLVMVGLGTAHLGTFPTTSAASTAGLQAAAAALAFLVFAVAAADALWDM